MCDTLEHTYLDRVNRWSWRFMA